MGMNVSDTLAGTFKLKASTTIDINDAVGIGPDGRGYPIAVTDYAAVTNCTYGTAQTSTATGRIFAGTQVIANINNSNEREPVVIDSEGKIWTAVPYSLANGLRLKVFTSVGTLLWILDLDTSASIGYDKQLKVLANGNILVSVMITSYVYYQIFTPQGVTVCSYSSVANRDAQHRICPLAGGGFALLSRYGGDGTSWQLATFDNSGVAVLAVTTIFNQTNSTTYPAIEQLSNGDLVVGLYRSSYGLYAGVVTTAAVSVAAFVQLDATVSMTPTPAISVIAGYYCIGWMNGSNTRAAVFSNAGVQQGGNFSASSTGVNYHQCFDLVTDGTQFWLIHSVNTDSSERLAKIPVTGTNFVSTNITTITSNYAKPVSAFYSNGKIAAIFQITGNQYLYSINTDTGLLVSPAESAISFIEAGYGYTGQILDAGDYAFVYFYQSGASTINLVAGKYANTSIVGVAASSAVENGYVNMYQAAGTYPVNTLKGSPAVAFDHTTGSTIAGNKGTILTNGLVLKGM